MLLISLSVTHHSTPVELRECLSLPEETLAQAIASHPLRSGAFEQLSELAILSTCNRLEVYAVSTADTEDQVDENALFKPLKDYLGEIFQVSLSLAQPYFRHYLGIEAAAHLFQVAAGLDSIAIGETQILGQVSHAMEMGLELGTTRHVLSSLFRAAIHTGKRVHSETEIGRHPTSISTLAIQLAEANMSALDEKAFLVIGAGKMGGYALQALAARSVRQVVLTNRTFAHAQKLVQQYGGQALPYEQLEEGLAAADAVIASTAAPVPILPRELLARVMAHRPDRPLALIDLAVPRNVAPDVHTLPGVQVFDMDDLQVFARNSVGHDQLEISHAEAIVSQEIAEYDKLLRIVPLIGELHKKVEKIRQREVEKTLRQLHDPDPEISERIEVLSRSLVRKILHEPTMHLRTEDDQDSLNQYAESVMRLFDLPLDHSEIL